MIKTKKSQWQEDVERQFALLFSYINEQDKTIDTLNKYLTKAQKEIHILRGKTSDLKVIQKEAALTDHAPSGSIPHIIPPLSSGDKQ
jgi:uncharacterized coiled-coil protein SlyX